MLILVGTVCAIIFLSWAIQSEAGNVSCIYDEVDCLTHAITDDSRIITCSDDKIGNRIVKDIPPLQEAVSRPSKPIGPVEGTVETLYPFSTGGSFSHLGHPVQYLFDWGDGTNSGWLPAGQTRASKVWSDSGTYDVVVRARCAIHNFVLSAWSEALSVEILPIQIDLQFPSNEAAFNCCSLITPYQPSFGWIANGIFAQYTILLSTSLEDFTTKGVLITKATVPGTASSWTPIAPFWKTILVSSHNKGAIREIYWKVVGTKADKKTVESEVRSFGIGDPQKVTIVAPSNQAVLSSAVLPSFQFNSNCNIKFSLEFSTLRDFSDPTLTKLFTFTTKDPHVEAVVRRVLSLPQWTSVRQFVGSETGYFRIKAWDGINRETYSQVRSFTIPSP